MGTAGKLFFQDPAGQPRLSVASPQRHPHQTRSSNDHARPPPRCPYAVPALQPDTDQHGEERARRQILRTREKATRAGVGDLTTSPGTDQPSSLLNQDGNSGERPRKGKLSGNTCHRQMHAVSPLQAAPRSPQPAQRPSLSPDPW